MITVISLLVFVVAIFLILLVLVQDSKGAMGGVMGGGGSNTLWGASGAATFLEKLTRVVAIVFFISCFALTLLTMKHSSTSVMDNVKVAPNSNSTTPNSKAAETQQQQKANNNPNPQASDNAETKK